MVLNKIFSAIGLGSHSHQWTSPHTTAPNGTPLPTPTTSPFPNMGIGTNPFPWDGSHTHTVTAGHNFHQKINAMRRHPKAKWRKKNKLLNGLSELVNVADHRMIDDHGYFHHITIADAISGLGDLRPYYSKKPTKWATLMLEAAASGYVPRSLTAGSICLTGERAGIFYSGPGVMGVKKKKYYLTPAGLAVLHHWAEKSANFARFVDAYVTKDSHKKAAEDCGQLAFGVVPDWMIKDRKKNEEKVLEYNNRKANEMLAKQKANYEAQRQVDMQRYYAGINRNVPPQSITGF